MTNFQLLTVVPLCGLALWDLVGCLRRSDRRALRGLRFATSISAAAAIANPAWVTRVADATGIGRGADLVLYSFAIVTMIMAFYFYTRQLDLQRQITELVRHAAVKEAQRGGDSAPERAENPDGDAP